MFAIPAWISDIVAAYWFFSVAKAYSNYSYVLFLVDFDQIQACFSITPRWTIFATLLTLIKWLWNYWYRGYRPMGFPGTATFAGILTVGQLVAVPFMLYFTQTAGTFTSHLICYWIPLIIISSCLFRHLAMDSSYRFFSVLKVLRVWWKLDCTSPFIYVCDDTSHHVSDRSTTRRWFEHERSSVRWRQRNVCFIQQTQLIMNHRKSESNSLSLVGNPTQIFFPSCYSASNAPMFMLLAVLARIFIGACYMWWYQEEHGGNVVRHYGYLGSLARLYYAKCTPSDNGATLSIRDQIAISAGSATNYIGNSTSEWSHRKLPNPLLNLICLDILGLISRLDTVVNTTFASAESFRSDDKATTLSAFFPVWRTTWFLMLLNAVPFGLMIWVVTISPFWGSSRPWEPPFENQIPRGNSLIFVQTIHSDTILW